MDVVLPGTIQRQLDEAAAIEASLYGEAEAPAPVESTEGNTEVAETNEPVVETQAQQQAEDVAPPAPKPVQDDVWEQKFNVLRGKYEAEVPRLHSQIRELTEQLQSAVSRLDSMATKPEPVADPVAEADEEKFGSDLIEAVRRAAQAEVAKATKDIDKKVDAAVKPVAEKQVQDANARFWNAVDSGAPDFDQVNADPRWFQFLDTRIVGTQMTHRDAANAAVAKHDATALLELVNTWKQSVAPAPSPQVPGNTPSREDLNRQVAPTTRRDAAAPQPQGRVWTGAEYEAAQDPRNLHRMPKDEYEKLVAESELALQEGRVKW